MAQCKSMHRMTSEAYEALEDYPDFMVDVFKTDFSSMGAVVVVDVYKTVNGMQYIARKMIPIFQYKQSLAKEALIRLAARLMAYQLESGLKEKKC